MRITVLTVADCPNARPALERVTAALDGRQAQVELVEVVDERDAVRLGMSGSPTILIDGTDPFAPPVAAPSLSCRLYRDAAGTVSGVPDESALRRALAGTTPQARDAGTPDCCPRSRWMWWAGVAAGAVRPPRTACARCTSRSCGISPRREPLPSRRRFSRWRPWPGGPLRRC